MFVHSFFHFSIYLIALTGEFPLRIQDLSPEEQRSIYMSQFTAAAQFLAKSLTSEPSPQTQQFFLSKQNINITIKKEDSERVKLN